MSVHIIQNDKAKAFVDRMSEILDAEGFIRLTKVTGDDRDEYLKYLQDMKQKAVAYTKWRADWEFMDQETRISKDSTRTNNHDAYMLAIKLLIRLANSLADNRWADLQKEVEGMQRQDLGDIACYLTYLIAVSNR